jgi:hypothetical protein
MEIEVIKVDYFYNKFNYSGLNNFESLSPKKAHQRVSYKLYKEILLKFFTIYFYDVYFLKRSLYFFFGGSLKINKCGNWIRENKKEGLKKANWSIGLFWYNRPCRRFEYAFKLKKQTGSSNRLPIIENEWKKSNDIGLLKTLCELKKEFSISKFFK